MDKVIQTINEYSKQIEKHPELAGAIERLIKDHNNLKKSQEERIRLKGMVAHEIRAPITLILGFSDLLKQNLIKDEKLGHTYDILYRASIQLSELSTLLNLSGSSKSELREESQTIILENIARNNGKINHDFMKDEKINLNLKYNRVSGEPIEIYANSGVIEAIWGTLYGNCLCWTTPDSTITQGIRITKSGKLEISMENDTNGQKQRKSHGMGRGRGFPFVSEIVKTLGGDLLTYRTPQNRTYEFEETFGYQTTTKNYNNLFGVKIQIPMSELKE